MANGALPGPGIAAAVVRGPGAGMTVEAVDRRTIFTGIYRSGHFRPGAAMTGYAIAHVQGVDGIKAAARVAT